MNPVKLLYVVSAIAVWASGFIMGGTFVACIFLAQQ